MFYNALCAVASFDLLNILNISFNINTVIWKKIVYYFVLFHDMLHYKDKPAKQWNSHLFYFLFNWLVIHIKKWVAIINKMLRRKGKCICLCWAYGWLHFKTFAIQYFFFLIWTVLYWHAWKNLAQGDHFEFLRKVLLMPKKVKRGILGSRINTLRQTSM